MSLDWDSYVSHPRGPEGSMRTKAPWSAMRLNNSRSDEMFERVEYFRIKSEKDRLASSGGRGRFTPKDLELFQASRFQQLDCFKGYDKITNAPRHGYLPRWNVTQAAIDRVGGRPASAM